MNANHSYSQLYSHLKNIPQRFIYSLSIYTLVSALASSLLGCGSGASNTVSPSKAEKMSDAAQLGELIFKDITLSSSGKMACASCHDSSHGHASPFETAVAFGGAALDQPGGRSPSSIRYLKFNDAFRFASDGTPTGGFNWDGRANSLAEQAKRPFLSANEMANVDATDVIAKIAQSSYAEKFRTTFGTNIFNSPDTAFERVTFALERYQKEDPDFAPFNSKFDAFTAGKAKLSEQELNGLALFNRADKGNCAACHPSTKPSNAPAALFTDFTYDSVGVPRNNEIAMNADSNFFDMGLCGPTRSDLTVKTDSCGKFKVPSLRNAALRKRFFHNGRFDSLTEVVRFYVQRGTNPEKWYPKSHDGGITTFDDLPTQLRVNVNQTEGPYNRGVGQVPALTETDIADVVAFLGTLTDGYKP